MTEITITEDVAQTMAEAALGPRWTEAYDAAQAAYRQAEYGSADEAEAEEAVDALDAAQQAGEAEYGARWADAARQIAAARGYEARILLTSEHWRASRTAVDQDGGDTVEREIWQAAHDATDLPEGW